MHSILNYYMSILQGEKIQTILKAANVNVESYWPGLFAKALEGINVKELITNIGSGVGAAPAGAGMAYTFFIDKLFVSFNHKCMCVSFKFVVKYSKKLVALNKYFLIYNCTFIRNRYERKLFKFNTKNLQRFTLASSSTDLDLLNVLARSAKEVKEIENKLSDCITKNIIMSFVSKHKKL